MGRCFLRESLVFSLKGRGGVLVFVFVLEALGFHHGLLVAVVVGINPFVVLLAASVPGKGRVSTARRRRRLCPVLSLLLLLLELIAAVGLPNKRRPQWLCG